MNDRLNSNWLFFCLPDMDIIPLERLPSFENVVQVRADENTIMTLDFFVAMRVNMQARDVFAE